MPDRWLEELSKRIQSELRSRPIQFLIERELQDVERSRLYDELSRRYVELWRPVFGPCIALAAVHAAADASREDTSFIELMSTQQPMRPGRTRASSSSSTSACTWLQTSEVGMTSTGQPSSDSSKSISPTNRIPTTALDPGGTSGWSIGMPVFPRSVFQPLLNY
jgi:hypothetical protein